MTSQKFTRRKPVPITVDEINSKIQQMTQTKEQRVLLDFRKQSEVK